MILNPTEEELERYRDRRGRFESYRKELEAVTDDAEREVLFQEMVDRMYEHGKALNTATHFEIDDVIDPADTRRWLVTLLDAAPEHERSADVRPNVDTW